MAAMIASPSKVSPILLRQQRLSLLCRDCYFRCDKISMRYLSSSTDSTSASTTTSVPSSSSSSTPSNTNAAMVEQYRRYWDDATGISELNQLKVAVERSSRVFDASCREVASARAALEEANAAHETATKKHAALFLRRDTWTEEDATAFVSATSQQQQTERELVQARERLKQAEDATAIGQRNYMDAMRTRYHEEQMWQDKWRLLGTYGTWALIGLNSLLFLGGQFFYRRREQQKLQAMEAFFTENMLKLTQQVNNNSNTQHPQSQNHRKQYGDISGNSKNDDEAELKKEELVPLVRVKSTKEKAGGSNSSNTAVENKLSPPPTPTAESNSNDACNKKESAADERRMGNSSSFSSSTAETSSNAGAGTEPRKSRMRNIIRNRAAAVSLTIKEKVRGPMHDAKTRAVSMVAPVVKEKVHGPSFALGATTAVLVVVLGSVCR